MNTRNLVIFLMLLVLVSATAQQKRKGANKSVKDSTYVLKQVDVLGTSELNKNQLTIPASTVKLSSQEIDRNTGLFMVDAINTNVPGVFMSSRTVGAGQQLNIRGYGNGMGVRGISNNFDSQGMKMYLNGIPVTDAEGITVMDDIDFSTIGAVDILKGPAGTQYGFANAGVVNLQTKKGTPGKTTVGVDYLRGSYGLDKKVISLSTAQENSNILLNYGHQKYDGFMRHTASKKDFVSFIGDFQLNKKQSLTSFFGFTDSYDQRNGELNIDQYDTLEYVKNPSITGNPAYVKNDAHSAMRTFRAGVGHVYKFDPTFVNTTSIFGFGQNYDNSSAGGWTDKTAINYGIRSVFQKNFNITNDIQLIGTAGLELQKENAQMTSYGMSADLSGSTTYNIPTTFKSNQVLKSGVSNYFTQWTFELPLEISVAAGVGVSNMSMSLNDRLYETTNKKLKIYNKGYNNLVSPNVSVNKKFGENASVFVNYSTSYRAPVSSNLIISYTGQVDSTLVPEKGNQIELGTKGNWLDNRLFYSATLFRARFENKFTSVAVLNTTQTATLYSYLVNGGSQNDNGFEAAVSYELIKSNDGVVSLVRPFANLTYSDFKYDVYKYQPVATPPATPVDYSGKKVAGVAPVVWNAGVDMATKYGVYANVTFNHRDAMYITSDNTSSTRAYDLLNAKLGYRATFFKVLDLDASVGATNLTNQQYYQMVFVNQLPDAYIPAAKNACFYGGISLKYNF